MEQEPLTSSQTAGNKLVPIVTSSALIAALVAGGGVYAYEKSQRDTAQANLQSQIDSLKMQVATKASSSPIATASPLATATPSATSSPSATADPTAGWKTYTEQSAGITFKYPSDLTAGSESSYVNSGIAPLKGVAVTTANIQGKNTDTMIVEVDNLPFKKENISGVYFKNGEGTTPVTLAGRTAYKYQQGDAGLSETDYAFPSKDSSKIVTIRVQVDHDIAGQQVTITPKLDTIIGTLAYLP